ncbi:unnamed protein product [Ilex paraguariensis]|uniref:Uncharacterized protein n=1 Tax=Ilex paraguariensis TaxID=185542 RepID=A0ABC8U4U1_9AQUA
MTWGRVAPIQTHLPLDPSNDSIRNASANSDILKEEMVVSPIDEDNEDQGLECLDEPIKETALVNRNYYHREEKEDVDVLFEFELNLRPSVGSNGFDDVKTSFLFSDVSVQRHECSTENS